jgi:hypothetical protein
MDRASKDAIPAIPSVIGETASTKRGGADHRESNWLLRILMGLCSMAEMLDRRCCCEGKVSGPKETVGIFVFGGLLLFFREESRQGVNQPGPSRTNGFLFAAAGGNVVPHNDDGGTRAAAIVWEAKEGGDDAAPMIPAPPPLMEDELLTSLVAKTSHPPLPSFSPLPCSLSLLSLPLVRRQTAAERPGDGHCPHLPPP